MSVPSIPRHTREASVVSMLVAAGATVDGLVDDVMLAWSPRAKALVWIPVACVGVWAIHPAPGLARIDGEWVAVVPEPITGWRLSHEPSGMCCGKELDPIQLRGLQETFARFAPMWHPELETMAPGFDPGRYQLPAVLHRVLRLAAEGRGQHASAR